MWTRLGDNYGSRRFDLSDSAYRLDNTGLIESNRNGWGGLIPRNRLRTMVPRFRQATVDELVEAGFWREEGDGYRLVDEVIKDQLSIEEAERQRESNRSRQARWRDKQRANHDAAERNAVTPPVTRDITGVTNGRDVTHPGLSRPEGREKNDSRNGLPGDTPGAPVSMGALIPIDARNTGQTIPQRDPRERIRKGAAMRDRHHGTSVTEVQLTRALDLVGSGVSVDLLFLAVRDKRQAELDRALDRLGSASEAAQ